MSAKCLLSIYLLELIELKLLSVNQVITINSIMTTIHFCLPKFSYHISKNTYFNALYSMVLCLL